MNWIEKFRSRRRRETVTGSFDLDSLLLQFNRRRDGLSVRDILGGGVLVMGDSGSGKTSGTLAHLVCAAHSMECSVVHVSVKPSDPDYWSTLGAVHGRPVRRVGIGKDRFNPLAYEQFRTDAGRGLVEDLTRLITLPLRRPGGSGGSGVDGFWRSDAERYVRHLVTIFAIAGVPLSYRLIYETLQTLPASPEEVGDSGWQERCPAFGALEVANGKTLTAIEKADLDTAGRFLLSTVPTTPDRTRASTVATISSALDPLIRGPIGEALCGSPDTWQPNECFTDSPVLVLDAPLQTFGAVGATIQRIWLTAIQRAILRREVDDSSRPIVLVADEFQEFLDPEDDPAFMRTARDRMGCMVLATQCVGNIRAACSGGPDPRAAAEAILGLPAVKFFGATSDPETLRYAGEVFAKSWQARVSHGMSEREGGDGRPGGGSGGRNANFSLDLHDDVPAIELLRLARGGPACNWNTEAFCSVSGRTWRATGRPSIKVAFNQYRPS